MPVQFPWLPVGHALPDGTLIGGMKNDGRGYQIVRSRNGGRTILLVEKNTKAAQWLIDRAAESVMQTEFFGRHLATLVTSEDAEPIKVTDIPKRAEPLSSSEAAGLLRGLSEMADTYPAAVWSEAVFIPELSVCLPIAENDEEDRRVLAFRLVTGGVENTVLSPRQIRGFNPWLTKAEILEFLDGFGFTSEAIAERREAKAAEDPFSLPGRPELESFFKEYVIEQHRLRDNYAAMGVQPPNGILLYGPPGSGKTFAVKILADYLGWPVFELGIGEIGRSASFIHQTTVKLNAMLVPTSGPIRRMPSIIIVATLEVDALAGSPPGIGSQDYKIESLALVSEFLKLVESGAGRGITLVATTNRKDHCLLLRP